MVLLIIRELVVFAQIFGIKSENEMFGILEQKLWDDAKREVRLGVSQAFTLLSMRSRFICLF